MSLSNFLINERPAWLEALMLLGVGAAIVAFHAILRVPLKLPGRHGLEWMALVVMARTLSGKRWAATTASAGASAVSMLPMWGFHEPLLPITYLVPGIVVDLAFLLAGRLRRHLVVLTAIGAMAYVTKPLIQYAGAIVSGWRGPFLGGLWYPLGTHLFFGLAGSLVGAGLALSARKASRETTG